MSEMVSDKVSFHITASLESFRRMCISNGPFLAIRFKGLRPSTCISRHFFELLDNRPDIMSLTDQEHSMLCW